MLLCITTQETPNYRVWLNYSILISIYCQKVRWIRSLTFSLVCGLLLLLILSGDIELNPGPITGNTKHHINDIVLIYTELYR